MMLPWPLLLLGPGALAAILRPEEHWREAGAREGGRSMAWREVGAREGGRNMAWREAGVREGWVSGTSSRKEVGRPRAACGVEGPSQQVSYETAPN